MTRDRAEIKSVRLYHAFIPVVERLELRQLMAIDTVQSLPFRLDFNASVADSLLDKDGQGIGLTRVQTNRLGTEYQPSLLDVDTASGLLRIVTSGTSSIGSNSNTDNTQVNALETQFAGTTSGFAINARLIGPMSYLAEQHEQAGIFFGPDQDNYVKLVAAFTSSGARLMFLMENNASGTVTQNGGSSTQLVNIGSFANVNTLDLRIVGDAATGVVQGFYAVNGGAFVKIGLEHTIPAARQSAFFNATSRGGLIAYHKNNNGPITAIYDSFEITPGSTAAARPSVTAVSPASGATNVGRDAFIAVDVRLPNAGHGVDATSLSNSSVKLYKSSTGSVITGVINTTGGGDAIIFTPTVLLEANATYTFEVTALVKDTSGAAFQPFSSTFTTGTAGGTIDPSIAFEKQVQSVTQGHEFTSVTIGPDGRLYATTHDGKIIRYAIGSDGTLASPLIINTITTREAAARLVTGLVFHPNSTAQNLVAYVSHGEFAFDGATDWTGKVTKLSGPNLETGVDLVTGLPRSIRDHLNNQMVFGPDGRLYLSQASNSAMGAPDSAWGFRSEHLLSAAILQIDLNLIPSPVNVRTEGVPNPYNPFAANAPVRIYATGVRNAYDLLWHSNGFLYAPTNGSASGGAAPASPNPAYSENRIDQSIFGAYSGPVVPGIARVPTTQNDYLFKVEPLGYYGHPNPDRYEWVLNGGNPTSGIDRGEVAAYPVGTQPDRNYRGFAYDFGRNYSPNGVIEFRGGAFNGALDGKILVVRYSGGDDIIVLQPGSNGDIVASQTGITGFNGFVDPLDLIQDSRTGHLYVAEYGGRRITLLRATTVGGNIEASKGVFYFNDQTSASGNSAASPSQRLTIRNTGAGPLTISQLTLGGANASEFLLVSPPATPITLAAGQSVDVQVAMRATSVGLRTATLTVASNDPDTPSLVVNLRGLGTTGTGGANEPSLQRILDLYQLPIHVGDADPSTTDHFLPGSGGPVTPNDEQVVQRLVKAGPGDVRVELLAVMANSVTPAIRFGYYEAGTPGNKAQLFTTPQSDAQSVNPTANGSLTFDPGSGAFALYGSFPAFSNREVYSEDQLNTWETNTSLQRKVRFYPLKNPDGSLVPNAFVFAFEEFTSAFDSNDIVGIIRNVQVAPASPQMGLENRDGVPFYDRLVFNRVRDPDPLYPNEVKDRATLRLRNTGTQPLNVTNLVLSSTSFAFDTGFTAGPRTIAPGAFLDVPIRFVYNRTGDGVTIQNATLTIQSNDPETPSRSVQLSGIWQSHSEANPNGVPQEPRLQQLLDVLGYNVKVTNTGQNVNTGGNVVRVGEEVLSPYWLRAESGPVVVRMLAAYHQQAADRASTIRWHLQGSTTTTNLFKHRAEQGQALLPTINGSTVNPAQATFQPNTAAFGFRVDGTWSDPALNVPNSANDAGHGMRWYIAKDRAGNVIPNTYILAHDYVGVSYSNYDYQDNIYLVSNVMPVSPPATPTGLTAAAGGAGITLNWTRNTEGNVAGYRVLRAATADGPYTLLADLVTGTSFVDASAPVGQVSFYRLVAVNVHGNASSHASASAIRGSDTTPPAMPTLVTAVGSSTGITLDWANNTEPDLAGYIVYRASSANGTFVRLNTSGLLFSSDFIDTLAPSNATSFYRISAVDTAGNESAFATTSAFRPAASTAPAAPSNLVAVATSATQVTLTWTDNSSNETGFRIERRTASGTFAVVGTVNADVTTFVDTTVSAGTSYVYRLRATGASGDSAYGNESPVTTPQGVPAAATALGAVANSPTQVTLTWTDNSGNESGFRIERRDGASATWNVLFTTAANVTTFTDTAVSGGLTYTYRVVAINVIGAAAPSNEATVVTQPAAPTAPSNLAGTVNAGVVALTWNDNSSDETGFQVLRSSDGVTFDLLATAIANATGYTDTTVVNGTTYFYRVRAVNAAGSSAVSNTVTVTVGTVSSSYTGNDVGGPAFPGSHAVLTPDADFDVVGGGNSFWGSSDQFYFLNRSVTGDFDVRVRIDALVGGGADPMAGLMARESLDGNSRHVFMNARPSTLRLNWRASTGGTSSSAGTGTPGYPNAFLRLRRVGNVFTGFASTNGTTWTQVGQVTLSLPQTVFFGLATGAKSSTATVTARYRGLGDTFAATAPSAPTNLLANAGSATSVTLNWTDTATNETGFVIERRTGSSTTWEQVGTAAANASTFTDNGAQPQTQYAYRVVAVAGTLRSGPSNEVTLTTPALSVTPNAPSGLVANVAGPAVVLAWTDNATNETGFQLERRVAGSTNWTLLQTLAANATGFTDSTVAAGTSYEYRVRAINGAGPSAYSGIAAVTTPQVSGFVSADVGNPSMPGSTTELSPGRDFDLVAGGADVWGTADQFRFAYRSMSGDFDVKVRLASMTAADVGSTGGLMVRESLAAGSRHAFIRARTDSFRFNWRDVSDGRSFGVTGAATTAVNVWLRLQRVGNVLTGYSSADGTNWTQVHQLTMTLPGTVLLGMAGTARTNAALSTFRFRDFGNTAAALVGSSFDLVGSARITSVNLAWSNTPDGASGYRVERASGGVWSTIAEVGAAVTAHVDSNVTSGASYVYRVIALWGSTEVGESNAVALTIPSL